MKICIISRTSPIEVEYLIEEAKKRNHEVDVIDPFNFQFVLNPDFKIEVDNFDLLSYDAFLMRACGMKNKETGRESSSKNLISHYLTGNSKIVMDNIETIKATNRGKLVGFYRLSQKGLPIFPTVFVEKCHSFKNIKNVIEKNNFQFPLILKNIIGRKGKDIYKVNSFEEIEEIIKNNIQVDFMIQPFMKIDHDLRVVVVGNKAIGAMDKVHSSDDFRGNISAGAVGINFPLTSEISELAVKAANADGAELSGVDIGICGNKLFILEVNRVPQFAGFVKYTGVSVAKEVIEFLENEFNNK